MEEALQVARQQVENGAQILDINMDDALLDSESCMKKFLQHLNVDPKLQEFLNDRFFKMECYRGRLAIVLREMYCQFHQS